ncbi:uncharacterized protein [Montipora capricornis]|uniref:uncharacterized protein isoform X2 n=1 Tax=Montipora capricornis TaxID=246305 RepID=UPI0035F1859D
MVSNNTDHNMAAMKQCVACNRQIPRSWNCCQCGHVLTETLTIAGKRFSDYRAELYTRLVIQESKNQARKSRMRRNLAKPGKTLKREESKSLNNRFRSGRKRKRIRPLLLKREATTTTRNTGKLTVQTCRPTEKNAGSEQQRETSKSLTSALAEINKRLQNQSKLWACLASGLPISTNT